VTVIAGMGKGFLKWIGDNEGES